MQRVPVETVMQEVKSTKRRWLDRFTISFTKRDSWNLGSLTIAAIISQLCGAANVLLLTNALGADEYGVFAFALSVQSYLMILGSAGLRPIVLRELTRHPESLNQVWTSFLSITLCLGVGLALSTTVVACLFAPTNAEKAVFAIIGLGNIAACTNMTPFFDFRHDQSRLAALTVVAEVAALILLMVSFFSDTLNLLLASLIFSLKWVGMSLLFWISLRSELPSLRWEWSTAQSAGLARSSWKLVVSSMFATIPLTGGVLLVRFFHGDSAAGVFAVAMYAPRALFLLVGQLNRVLQPYVMSDHGQQRQFIIRTIIAYPLFLAITAACCLAGLWIVVTHVLAPEFHGAFASGAIMLGGSLMLACGSLCTQYLIAVNAEHLAAVVNMVTAVVYLLAAIALVPAWASIGASWAMVSAALLMVASCAVSICVSRGRFPRLNNLAQEG